MKAVRGKWMLVSLVFGLALSAHAEVEHGGTSGTSRRQLPAGADPERVFSDALNACGLSRPGGFGSSFTAAPPPPPPALVFPPEGDALPALDGESQLDNSESSESPKPSASTASESKPATPTPQPPPPGGTAPKDSVVSQAQAHAIMAKVNCGTCHQDGRKASDDPEGTAAAFTTVPKMKAKLAATEIDQLTKWVASQK